LVQWFVLCKIVHMYKQPRYCVIVSQLYNYIKGQFLCALVLKWAYFIIFKVDWFYNWSIFHNYIKYLLKQKKMTFECWYNISLKRWKSSKWAYFVEFKVEWYYTWPIFKDKKKSNLSFEFWYMIFLKKTTPKTLLIFSNRFILLIYI
jgi:hypothetical protein